MLPSIDTDVSEFVGKSCERRDRCLQNSNTYIDLVPIKFGQNLIQDYLLNTVIEIFS